MSTRIYSFIYSFIYPLFIYSFKSETHPVVANKNQPIKIKHVDKT